MALSRTGRFAGLVARPLLAVALGWVAVPGPCLAAVELTRVPTSSSWPGATQEDALRLACSPSVEELEGFFRREGLPFRRDLVRSGPEACHVFYRPTVPGFRASPDDDPLREILFDADALTYLATAPVNRGESLGAMTQVLRRIRRPLDVGVLLHRIHEEPAYERATARAFGDTPHRVRLRERGVERNFWWVQDYVKSGASARGETILIPHRLFEGRSENANVYDPLLEHLSEDDRVVRSNLSWEGGDLQFTRDPRDPGKLVLYYGSFVKPYWGESLSPKEFEHVLMLEFGADRAVDLGGLAPHVDYFVSFLPRGPAALVSVPRSGDLDLARAVVETLRTRLAGDEPQVLVDLGEALSSPAPDPAEIARLVHQARGEQGGWSFAVDAGLFDRTEALVARVCPDEEDCFDAEDQVRLAQADPDLFEEWIHSVQLARDEQRVVAAHLDLLESQIEVIPGEIEERTREKIAELESLGFQVIQVPAYRVNLQQKRTWPGISYVNALVVDEQVFVPRFGLGEVEDGIFRLLDGRLPSGYSIVPIDAQRVLIRNGGLHCLAGLIR
ncbi:MAG: agmatine deiminase family protein [Acidobacteria bacterium]|nr:agmatine deiminase family protein [Acidobacteriota bacterium]